MPDTPDRDRTPAGTAKPQGPLSKARAAAGPAVEQTLVILPTFNERPNLEGIVGGVREQGCDVVVVDDNSPDGTGDLADTIARADPGVHVVHRFCPITRHARRSEILWRCIKYLTASLRRAGLTISPCPVPSA